MIDVGIKWIMNTINIPQFSKPRISLFWVLAIKPNVIPSTLLWSANKIIGNHLIFLLSISAALNKASLCPWWWWCSCNSCLFFDNSHFVKITNPTPIITPEAIIPIVCNVELAKLVDVDSKCACRLWILSAINPTVPNIIIKPAVNDDKYIWIFLDILNLKNEINKTNIPGITIASPNKK